MVDSGMGLLYRLPSLCNPADRYDSLMPELVESTISPNQGLRIWPLPQAFSIRNTSNRIERGEGHLYFLVRGLPVYVDSP